MRIWVDLTNSPHVLVMRPVIDVLRARGAEVRVTARDFAQTLGLCERFGIEHTVIGHHRGGGVAAKAVGLVQRSGPLVRWARRNGPLTSRSGTVRTTSPSRRRCSASRARRCSTTSGRPCSTPSTAGSRRGSWCRTRSRLIGCAATARCASSIATRGSRRSTTSPTSSRPRTCSTNSASTPQSPSRSSGRHQPSFALSPF